MSRFLFLTAILVAATAFAADDAVVVEVNGEAIRASEVQRAFDAAVKNRTLAPQAEAALKQSIVARLIDERLMLANLARQSRAVKPAEVEVALKRLDARLATKGGLAELLKERQMTREELAAEFSRRMTWQRYLDDKSTEENLQKFFDKFRREYDGTELRIAHILWKLPENCPPEQLAAAKQTAADLRAKIVAKEVSFADAARKHSQAPTAAEGGYIGWIRRREPMPEVFAKAAYALKKDEVSEPVVSPVGIHLILCTEEKPGTKQLADVADALRPAVAEYLLTTLAGMERERQPPPMIRYVDAAFQPKESP